MKKYLCYILGASFFLFLSACQEKEEVVPLPNKIPTSICSSYMVPAINKDSLIDCSNCWHDCQEVFSDVIRYDYFYPVFNPKNKNEIAYLRFDNTTWGLDHEIWTFNLCTGAQNKLVANAAYGLNWSNKDWLIYSGSDQQIWKIKSNGDSLTQMTFSGDYNRFPKWNPNGDKYLYNTQTGSIGFHIIANERGEALDTLEMLTGAGHYNWIDENNISYMVAANNYTSNLEYLNLSNELSFVLEELHHFQSFDTLVRSTSSLMLENSVVWSAIKVIGKTNIDTKSTSIIKEGYSNRRYETLDVSKDGSTILFCRQDIQQIDECNFDSEYRLFVMDANGKEERKILIPE